MSKPTVLVFCATGHTGYEISMELLRNYKEKVNIRLAVRDESKAEDFKKEGVEIVKCDWTVDDTIKKALQGVKRVWIVAPNPPPSDETKPFDRINLTKKVLPHLKEQGVEFILLGSVAGPESSIFTKEFRELEKSIKDIGISHCILRMTVFQENIMLHRSELTKGTLSLPLGKGKYPVLSVRDVGIAGAKILCYPDKFVGKNFILTGPESLTGDRMVEVLGKVLNRDIKYVDASGDDFRGILREYMPTYQIDGLMELFQFFKKESPEPSSHFKEITEQQGTTFEDRMKHLHQTGRLKL